MIYCFQEENGGKIQNQECRICDTALNYILCLSQTLYNYCLQSSAMIVIVYCVPQLIKTKIHS